MGRRVKNVFWFSLFLSFLFHLMISGGLLILERKDLVHKMDQVTIDIVTQEEVEKLIKKLDENRQIVEQDVHQANEQIPDKDYFLSRHNQTIKKQTRADNVGQFKNGNLKEKMAAQKPPDKKIRAKSQVKMNDSGLPSLSDLKPEFGWQPKKVDFPVVYEPGTVSQSDDYLKKVDKGLQTLLSTREFVYYSYYNRIRNQLREHWESRIKQKVEKIFRQGRGIASTQDHITKVVIILDNKGVLIKVQVIEESGIRDLDQAAIDAFKEAAPFPNPPKGIIDKNGTIKIHWNFVLEA